jgi:hypothetical protein
MKKRSNVSAPCYALCVAPCFPVAAVAQAIPFGVAINVEVGKILSPQWSAHKPRYGTQSNACEVQAVCAQGISISHEPVLDAGSGR